MIHISELSVGRSIVTVDNPKFHPKLKDVPLLVTGISKTKDVEGKMTFAVQLEHINQLPNTYYESYSQFLKYIKPIDLTPEILENCVFDYVDHFSCAKDCWLFKKTVGGGLLFQYQHHCNPKSRQLSICYLHRLQNFFYEIIGEELTVNP